MKNPSAKTVTRKLSVLILAVRTRNLDGVLERLLQPRLYLIRPTPATVCHAKYGNMVVSFCWRPGEMRVTPAMAAKVTMTLWSFDDLMMGGTAT